MPHVHTHPQGVCLHYHEWHRPRQPRNESDDRKMMFGLLFSLKAFAHKLDPTKYVHPTPRQPPACAASLALLFVALVSDAAAAGAARRTPESTPCTFHSFRTSKYKLHFLESATGIRVLPATQAVCHAGHP
jgi:hypothetical protein